MPELPEAETIARGLERPLIGREIRGVQVVHADVLRVSKASFRRCVTGRRIGAVGRRGKNVVLRLSGGHVLLVNLGMTGRLLPLAPRDSAPRFPPTHPALRFRLSGGFTLVFDDVRRFGTVECLSDADWSVREGTLGPEPLSAEFTPAELAQRLSGSRSPIRSWLLDQSNVAGVGNIYANEALWRAKIHPQRPARAVGPADAKRLHEAIRDVLATAIEARGTTLRDYRTAEGEPGGFSLALAVYGRQGAPCPECHTRVERLVFGNRSAFLCPRCQPDGGKAAP